jgi:hypothetical protein
MDLTLGMVMFDSKMFSEILLYFGQEFLTFIYEYFVKAQVQ